MALPGSGFLQEIQRVHPQGARYALNNRKRRVSPSALDLTNIAVRQAHIMGERLKRHVLLSPNAPNILAEDLSQTDVPLRISSTRS